MSADLIARLREGVADTGVLINTAATVNTVMANAADALEAQARENAELKAVATEMAKNLESTNGEWDSVAKYKALIGDKP